LSDGFFVVRRFGAERSLDTSSSRQTMSLLIVDSAGQPVDSVTGLPGVDVAFATPGGPGTAMRLARSAVFAVHPGGVFYGGQDDAGIVEFDRGLDRVAVTTTITRAEPITDEAKRAFQTMLDQGAHRPLGAGIIPLMGQEYAPAMPAFGDLLWGRDGRLWVQDPLRPGRFPLLWTAYRDGAALVRVELPPRFFPFEFGEDWVLGVSFDELAVERVELWRLVPGPLPGRALPPRDADAPIVARCGAWASR
jgi:hypothetical protein